MVAKLSKEVMDRLRLCLFVVALIERQALKLAVKLQNYFAPESSSTEDDGGLLYIGPLRALARKLRTSMSLLSDVDQKRRFIHGWLVKQRRVLDKMGAGIVREHGAIANTVVGQYVDPGVDELGLLLPERRDPVTILVSGQAVVSTFNEERVDDLLGESRVAEPTAKAQVAAFVPMVEEFGEKVEAVADGRRELQELQIEKNRLLVEHDVLVVRGSRMVEDLCRAVGDTKLAERLRPTSRRSSSQVEDLPPEELPPAEPPELPEPLPDLPELPLDEGPEVTLV